MTQTPAIPHRHETARHPRRGALSYVAGALALFAVAMLTGLAFAAWDINGPAMFHALAASGLAWCL